MGAVQNPDEKVAKEVLDGIVSEMVESNVNLSKEKIELTNVIKDKESAIIDLQQENKDMKGKVDTATVQVLEAVSEMSALQQVVDQRNNELHDKEQIISTQEHDIQQITEHLKNLSGENELLETSLEEWKLCWETQKKMP